MATQFDGKWIHRSFRNDQVVPNGAPNAGQPVLAALWAPPGDFQVSTDEHGAVTGSLLFPRLGITLDVTGQISEKVNASPPKIPFDLPPSVDLTATFAKTQTEYRLRGWFIPDSNVIVGTVLCVSHDLAKAPDGTMGPWVLTKVE